MAEVKSTSQKLREWLATQRPQGKKAKAKGGGKGQVSHRSQSHITLCERMRFWRRMGPLHGLSLASKQAKENRATYNMFLMFGISGTADMLYF